MSWQDIPGRHAMGWIIDGAIMRTTPSGVWVEVGVALGKGIARMARALLDAKRDDVRLYAIDPWEGHARNGEQQQDGPPSAHGDWALFLRMMQTHAPEELARIHVLRLRSNRACAAFGRKKVDLCIIDAAHDHESVLRDITMWKQTIVPGGTIGGDDHVDEYPGVQRACTDLFGKNYEVQHEDGWGTWRKVID